VAAIYMTRTVGGLGPADDDALQHLRKLKLGATVRADIAVPRNLKMHRKFFALLNTVWQAAGDWSTVEDLLTQLKLKLGLTHDVVVRESGEVVKVLGSISFAAMDQRDFETFYERALMALCELAGGIDSDMLRQAVLQQLAAA
jgi:hypothetical protein